MKSIPTSGDILRAFARTSMTAGARHVAEVIAAAISYDGRYRGAPRGHSAYTMVELKQATGLSERSVSNALRELAELFGLVVVKRHHQRHFFRFARIAQVAARIEADDALSIEKGAPDTGTGNPLPVPLYREENKNNNFRPTVQIGVESNVHRTPWADWIDRFKKGTPAEKMDAQYLWTGFCGLNRRHGHERVPLAYLIGFLRKYPKPASTCPAARGTAAPQARQSAADPEIPPLVLMARPAPYQNRHWHQSALVRLIGRPAYDNRVAALVRMHGGGRLAAELAVHGQAVRDGEIGR